jgi:hypothetical protein
MTPKEPTGVKSEGLGGSSNRKIIRQQYRHLEL